VDWFNPDGLRTWGDGRLFILGTEGSIEVRKYLDIARSGEGDHVFLVNGEEEAVHPAAGRTGFPFFGQFVLDCLNGTEISMTQHHVFKAAELCLEAQRVAVRGQSRGRSPTRPSHPPGPGMRRAPATASSSRAVG
jgi:hypothetical protein